MNDNYGFVAALAVLAVLQHLASFGESFGVIHVVHESHWSLHHALHG